MTHNKMPWLTVIAKLLTFVILSLCIGFALVLNWRAASLTDERIAERIAALGSIKEPLRSYLMKRVVTPVESADDPLYQLNSQYLQNNPLDPNAWLNQSILIKSIDPALSDLSLLQSSKLARNRRVLLKKIYTEQLIRGQIDDATDSAIKVVQARPRLFGLLFFDLYPILGSASVVTKFVEPIISGLDPEGASTVTLQLLEGSAQAGDLELANNAWRLLPTHAKKYSRQVNRYIDLLARKQESEQLQLVWGELEGAAVKQDAIFDNKLENVTEDSFCWSFRPEEGVEIEEPDGTGLVIQFDGTQNLGLNNIKCNVIVNGSTNYRLNYRWFGSKISTLSGVYVKITARQPDGAKLLASSEKRVGSWPWTSEFLDFTVPKNASVIVVSIARSKTYNLDNKLSGTLMLNDFTLERL